VVGKEGRGYGAGVTGLDPVIPIQQRFCPVKAVAFHGVFYAVGGFKVEEIHPRAVILGDGILAFHTFPDKVHVGIDLMADLAEPCPQPDVFFNFINGHLD